MNRASARGAGRRLTAGVAAALGGFGLLVAAQLGSSVAVSAATPSAGSSFLDDVTCLSTSWCMAVGSQLDAKSDFQTLAELWNGKTWTVLPSVNPADSTINYLNGVSCMSVHDCVAVGLTYSPGDSGFLPESQLWNGSVWKLMRMPSEPGAITTQLEGVKCVLATACIAVGSYGPNHEDSRTFAELWNGTKWAVTITPDPNGDAYEYLQSVSCTSTTSCMAVGGMGADSGHTSTLVETWNGTKWVYTASPSVSGAASSALSGVECNRKNCIAVGWFTAGGAYRALAEAVVSGHWSISTPGSTTGSTTVDSLAGVSCTSSIACVSVGRSVESTGTSTAAASWNGARWSVASVPTPSTDSDLVSVSCPVAGFCMAVGRNQKAALAESWNGKNWTTSPPPSTAG
jgi:hypothetical protein